MRFSGRLTAVAVVAIAAVAATAALATTPDGGSLTNVATANPKTVGASAPNILSPEVQEVIWAQGSMKLDGGTTAVPYYGYDGNGPLLLALGSNVEATKTEPDKNTYLVFRGGLKGPDPSYDYGTHFLFQGHELGSPGVITRINLDADGAHRVTLMSSQTDAGVPLHVIDGSTWDPFAERLLYTTESGVSGGQPTPSVYLATPDFSSHVDDISNVTGRAGFEGIQNDSRGNLIVDEDVGGATGSGANSHTKQPNSFIYRFVPKNASNLESGGKVQALQVLVGGKPLKFTMPASSSAADVAAAADTDISGSNSSGYVALHTYGTTLATKWITISTTTSSTPLPGADDNALAKAAGATPFKRPENGVFRPGSNFHEYYFDETGDTDNRTCAGGGPAPNPNQPACTSPNQTGGFGSIFKLAQSPTSDNGSISVLYDGDQVHSAFDNTAFFSKNNIAFVEDAGDTLHTQRNALDSAWMFDVTQDYSHGAQPVRFIAEGRDASATIDSGLGGTPGFQNEGDNEITGMFVSDGDTSIHGLLGEATPRPFKGGKWRAFWTQQHGDNPTYELIPSPRGSSSSGGD
jgi:hypothetical protein